MVSTRNYDNSSNKYKRLRSYAGISSSDIDAAISTSKKGEIKKRNPILKKVSSFSSSAIEGAINNVVRSVPGGEYLTNVKIYAVTKVESKEVSSKYVATGDVWGKTTGNNDIKGFLVNDSVAFTYDKDLRKILKKNFDGERGVQYRGKVIVLHGATATVQLKNKTVIDIPYSYLINLNIH